MSIDTAPSHNGWVARKALRLRPRQTNGLVTYGKGRIKRLGFGCLLLSWSTYNILLEGESDRTCAPTSLFRVKKKEKLGKKRPLPFYSALTPK